MSEPQNEGQSEPQDEPRDESPDESDEVQDATPPEEQTPEEQGVEQVAFDINDFPGGARSAIEAVLMVIDEPVEETVLASALELPMEDVISILETLASEYADSDRGFMLRRLGGRWRIYSKPAYAPVVEKFLMGGQQARLTQASLETLAVVAYRQPISRARVSAVRGVNVDGVVRTLVSRGLIEEVIVDGEPGQAALYGTTDLFLQRMGLDSLDDLPPLAPYLPPADVIEELASEGHA
ncbi:SMC-Scp complex subunit ScpB [Ornithinimicrobium faecis]|uniref:SMC-Scp complex subunit ScpB n=1 Tax=Ornithinimicrobium faecis TaxID=2934158 RepID=A0ABY4Z0I9_9MICO|nr:SMC-Scp complex subunit ScpB [Ornithinimicrobium sp. HY1793]USQ82040.1 SMC-Scp complex subunit ScpB [Ornithinimicrobium sp. HY1793]